MTAWKTSLYRAQESKSLKYHNQHIGKDKGEGCTYDMLKIATLSRQSPNEISHKLENHSQK